VGASSPPGPGFLCTWLALAFTTSRNSRTPEFIDPTGISDFSWRGRSLGRSGAHRAGCHSHSALVGFLCSGRVTACDDRGDGSSHRTRRSDIRHHYSLFVRAARICGLYEVEGYAAPAANSEQEPRAWYGHLALHHGALRSTDLTQIDDFVE